MERQPPEGFLKKGVMRNFAEFTKKKHKCRNLFFDKVKLFRARLHETQSELKPV